MKSTNGARVVPWPSLQARDETLLARCIGLIDGCTRWRHGRREAVLLQEVDAGARAPILRSYLAVAPGARAHLRVDPHAPLEEFDRIAGQYPVFRIAPDTSERRI